MDETVTKILDIKINQENAIQSLVDLQDQIKANNQTIGELQDKIKEWSKDEDANAASINEAKKQVAAIKEETAQYRGECAAISKEIQNDLKIDKQKTDSLKSLRAQLSNLTKQYDELSKEERMNKDIGGKLREEINRITDEIKGNEEATQRYGRNVGNYMNAMRENTGRWKTALEGAGVATQGLDKSMKLMASNPWMAVVSLLVGILVKLRDKLKENEGMTNSLGNATKKLSPIMEAFGKVVEWLANIFSKVLDYAIKMVIKSIEGLGKVLQKVGSWFGKDWGGGLITMADNMRANADSTDATTAAVEENTAAVKTATKAVKEHTEAVVDDTAEMLKQQQAYHDLYMKEMQKAEDALDKLISDEFEKRTTIEQRQYERKKKALEESMEAEKQAHGYGTDLYIAYDMQLEALEQEHANTMVQIAADQQKAKDKIQEEETKKALEEANKRMATRKTEAQYVNSIISDMSSVIGSLVEDQQAATAAQKIMGLAQVAINQGIAISEAVASAAEGDPYTYALRVASAVAAIVASMVDAISSINSAKFAEGGLVRGAGTTTSDSIPAMLSNKEVVVNAKSSDQYPSVLDAINRAGGGAPIPHPHSLTRKEQALLGRLHLAGGGMVGDVSSLDASLGVPAFNAYIQSQSNQLGVMQSMMQSMPRPVVSVEDINNGKGRVEVIDSLSRY